MVEMNRNYKAIVSSDWNECLAPCGPFDVISFNYPELASDLATIFQQYTSNMISLGEAIRQIQKILPGPITKEQMDAYLDKCFITYKRVPDLIEWCHSRNILFMVNTTGMVGYFQRIFTKGLLPIVPVVSAHSMIRYPDQGSGPGCVYDLLEIEDKSRNTEAAVGSFCIALPKMILIGDSGGDGPHFEWGAGSDAFLIGSMTKPSLEKFCKKRGIEVDVHFGISYSEGEKRDLTKEMQVDFMDLSLHIEQFLLSSIEE